MSANDPGHINNLDQNQRDLLKSYWLALISAINEEPSNVVESALGEELFYAFAHDDPDAILLRWLRARKWQVAPAVEMMMDTLKWRHEWGVRRLLDQGESCVNLEEWSSGKFYHMGKDKVGRPVSYVHAEGHIRGQFPMESTEKCLILFMELGRYFAEVPNEEGTVILDMGNVGLRNLDYQYIKFMINAMQNHYPECLGLSLVVNAPWSFSTVWSVIRRWLDPVVESKICFLKNIDELKDYINPNVIPKRLQGNHADFKYTPLTKNDEVRLAAIHNDEQGKRQAQMEHRQAAKTYLDMTLKWAKTQSGDEKSEEHERKKAADRLCTTYQQLMPYISTETHYHRTGMISRSMFNAAYDQISNQQQQTSST
ncbi:unnamed protein product [Adineta ricciae]|uniref:CRAL-TRIO domain-containing protein n=1 Tax=Adineta ricciae TaxID=249248 RepID=A0A814Y4E9_ADIRI|nr:unnamed protein product [Adineta ricciae]CAF1224015.1 unnamed protein product [Adineta ricciae]